MNDLTSPITPAPAEQDTEQRTRRRRVASVEIPEAIHAMATLTGQDAGDIIEAIVAAEVASIQAKAKAALVIGGAR